MKRIATARLHTHHGAHEGGVGTSSGCRTAGFRPAFLDFSTFTVYMSRFADGRLAPLHLLEGLPADVVAKGTLIHGFERGGFFYTRATAARACEEWRI